MNLRRIPNLKNLKSILWLLMPVLTSLIVYFLWVMAFGAFRHYFKFPLGDYPSPAKLTIVELIVYNGIQLLFVLGLFFIVAKLFKVGLLKALSSQQNYKKAWFSGIVIGWLFTSYVLFAESLFFCCPGLFPELIQPWYWLTIPEFGILGLVGLVYLIMVFRKRCL